jgi:hypothetical protein
VSCCPLVVVAVNRPSRAPIGSIVFLWPGPLPVILRFLGGLCSRGPGWLCLRACLVPGPRPSAAPVGRSAALAPFCIAMYHRPWRLYELPNWLPCEPYKVMSYLLGDSLMATDCGALGRPSPALQFAPDRTRPKKDTKKSRTTNVRASV